MNYLYIEQDDEIFLATCANHCKTQTCDVFSCDKHLCDCFTPSGFSPAPPPTKPCLCNGAQMTPSRVL